jgi:copper chaperone CopZ
MKRIVGFGVAGILLGAAVVFALQMERKDETVLVPAGVSAPSGRVLLGVGGLSCGSCETRIREALGENPAVRAVGVDLSGGTVTVDYVEGGVDPKVLADTVTRLGYPAWYLASGFGVKRPVRAAEGTRSGCGGGCCSGG